MLNLYLVPPASLYTLSHAYKYLQETRQVGSGVAGQVRSMHVVGHMLHKGEAPT